MNKKNLAVILFICIIFSLSVLRPNTVYACSCGNPGIEKRFELSSVVFTGTLISKDKDGGNIFSTDRIWKGNLTDGYVYSGFYGMCGTEFEVGNKYLVYTENLKGKESTSICNGNKLITEASKDIHALNQLTEPEWKNKSLLITAFTFSIAILIIWRVKLRFKNKRPLR